MPTNIGKMPQNQIDALPLLTADAISDPGDTITLGSQLIRHWTPVRTGINAIPRATYVNMLTKSGTAVSLPLDFSGMNSFVWAVSRQITNIAADVNATPQLRATPALLGQTPLPFDTVDGTGGLARIGQIISDFGTYNARAATGYTQYGYRGVSNSAQAFGGALGTLVGPGWFVWLDFATTPVSPANELWSLEIWAQS